MSIAATDADIAVDAVGVQTEAIDQVADLPRQLRQRVGKLDGPSTRSPPPRPWQQTTALVVASLDFVAKVGFGLVALNGQLSTSDAPTTETAHADARHAAV